MGWKGRLKDAVYIGLGLFLIGVLLLRADVTDTMERLSGIDLGILFLVLVLYLLNTFTKVIRWSALLKGMGIRHRGLITLPIFLSSLALNNSTPGKVGGEPVRALMLREHTGARTSSALASIFAEKSLDMLMILTMAVIGIIYMIIELSFSDVKMLMVGVGVGGTLVIMVIGVLLSRRLTSLMTGTMIWFARRVSGEREGTLLMRAARKAEGSMGVFQSSLTNLKRDRRISTGAVILTSAIWLNEALRLYLIVWALPGNTQITFLGAIAAVSVANILGFILPVGSGNVLGGTSVLVILTGKELLSTAASITAVATSIWISIPLGLVSLLYLRKRYKRSKRSEEEE